MASSCGTASERTPSLLAKDVTAQKFHHCRGTVEVDSAHPASLKERRQEKSPRVGTEPPSAAAAAEPKRSEQKWQKAREGLQEGQHGYNNHLVYEQNAAHFENKLLMGPVRPRLILSSAPTAINSWGRQAEAALPLSS